MSRSAIKDPAKSKSSETFFKVLRFIGNPKRDVYKTYQWIYEL